MTQPIIIEYRGEPKAKGRPRMGAHGVYTPEKTRQFEKQLLAAAWQQYNGKPLEGPLFVLMHVWVAIPSSWSEKRKGEHLGAWCESKPDIDNYLKMLDALNGFLYKDDSQIVMLTGSKTYSLEPGLTIKVYQLKSAKGDIQYVTQSDFPMRLLRD